MSKSDIRIVTSIDGFAMLKQFINSYVNKNANDNSMKNLLEHCDLQHRNHKQCYFGWNEYHNWEGYPDKNSEAIMEGLRFLKENNYSYRYYRLGEDKEDYDEHSFDSEKEGEKDLEYPNITRTFDDTYIVDILYRQKSIYLQEKDKEDLEI